MRLCRAAGFRPRIMQHALQYPTMLGLVSAGYGVALVPTSLRVLRPFGVTYVRLADPEATTSLALAWRSGLDDPGVAVVRNHARDVAAAVAQR